MNRSNGNPITGALLYYFVTICCGAMTYTWGRRMFLSNGDENSVIGTFILFGVIVCLAVFSLRRSTYQKIAALEPKTYKRILTVKGKQRPLEIPRGKNEQFSPQIENLISTYNTFRMVSVAMIILSLLANYLLLR